MHSLCSLFILGLSGEDMPKIQSLRLFKIAAIDNEENKDWSQRSLTTLRTAGKFIRV